ncbi:MAG TPA: PorV/PorQ family protein [bacterium]
MTDSIKKHQITANLRYPGACSGRSAVACIISLLIVTFAFSFTKVGTTAAPFLKIEFGARAAAMAGSFVALADDPSGVYYNPAGIAELDKTYLMGGHTVWFAGLMYDYAAFVLPSKRLNFCMWSSFLSSEAIEVTTVEKPDSSGLYYRYLDGLVGFTVSAFLSDRLSIGLSGKYIQQQLYHENAATAALDIGTILRTPLKGARLGMCLVNYGGRMQLSGNDLLVQTDPWPEYEGNPDAEARLTTESFPLPLAFKMGIALDVIARQGDGLFINPSHSLSIAIDGIHPNDGEEKLQVGAEYGLYDMLFLRAGYKVNYDIQNITAGFGLKAGIGHREIKIDYAYVNMGILDATHRVCLGIGF